MGFAESFILTLKGNNADRTTINVFQYEVVEAFPSVEDVFPELLDAFENFFFDAQTGTLNSDLFHIAQKYTSLSVYSLADPSPFLERVIAYEGLHATSEQMPRFVAYSVRSAKKSRGIRRGFKRFAGVPEIAANAGELAGNFLADLNVTADLLGSTMSKAVAPTYTFVPVVIGRVQYITPGGTIAYRFPESASEYNAFIADDWEAVNELTTQNTRKRGVGV